ncbi:MAG: 3-dehydroquinate synthase [Bacteroidia bacterium]
MKEIFTKEYKIYFGNDVLEQLSETLIEMSYSKVFVLIDENTKKYCWPILSSYLVDTITIEIKSGEASKNIQTASKVWESLQENFADRRAVLINLGGGVLSDLGGFVAATYKRGIDFINIPTTLLAMVDASVGGKQGLDMDSHKNVVGLFKHPTSIFIYPDFLKTLEKSELKNGFVELCKHGLIDDKKLWDKLQSTDENNLELLNPLIYQSIKIKVAIVKKDPLEKDIRKSLNFGHTIGHAFETFSLIHDKKPLKHGEAVAIGIICEAWLSMNKGWISQSELENIKSFFINRFPVYKNQFNMELLLQYMRNDKKNQNGQINFSLLKKIGKSKIDITCTDQTILDSIQYYLS